MNREWHMYVELLVAVHTYPAIASGGVDLDVPVATVVPPPPPFSPAAGRRTAADARTCSDH